MGGNGSMNIALKHPDLFCAVAAHSGGLDFSHFVDWIPVILSENGGVPVSSYIPTLQNTATYLFYTMAGAFSPNIHNTPYPVDFPLDSLGNFIDSTYSRWLLHDPVRLASKINQSYDLSLYFDCGEQDELLLYPFNVGFKDSLDKFGIKSMFKSYEGGHTNKLEERFPIALSFLDSVMKIQTSVYNEYRYPIYSFVLSQNYPNPFNPSTTIKFTLPRYEYTTLKVYNILGKEVSTIVANKLNQGNHTYTFDGKNLASGIYYYQLVAGDFREVRKMILLK